MASGEDLFWDNNQQASDSKDLSNNVKSAKIESNSIHGEEDKIGDGIDFHSKSALHEKDESSINIPKHKSIDIEELNETQRDQSNPINGN